jgi:hypothetical protein
MSEIRRRLKPRLHKRCPPPRTEENNIISDVRFSSTRAGGFCLCRRDFNRRDISNPRRRVLSVSPRFQSPGHLQPASAGFACVAAISIAGASSTRVGGFCLCRRDFNRRDISNPRRRVLSVSPRFQSPGHLNIEEQTNLLLDSKH